MSAYVKHQRDTEALTLLAEVQPNDFVTTADLMQERLEVEHQPELGYHRIGDSFGDDNFTFFSDNSLSRLLFDPRNVSLSRYGFTPGMSAGIPSLGTTGVTGDATERADFRQEIDYPMSFGQFRAVPYVLGRYTGYSDSPTGDAQNRLFAGTGLRMTTAFWKVDNETESSLFDIHRLRHVVEPEMQLFTSAQSVDRQDLFIYDEPIDAINDVSAAQFGFDQRWQTKRGGPGKWRSVDFFTLHSDVTFYANQPPAEVLAPTSGPYDAHGFRGLFYNSLPEASIPRNSFNSDGMWRISDATVLLADEQYNLDEQDLATASVGLAVQRDTRLSYFVGDRYIHQLNSNIVSVAVNYELSTKYSLSASQAYDYGQNQDVSSSFTITRRFDRFYVMLTVSYDETTGDSGFFLNVHPEGLNFGNEANRVQGLFQRPE